MKKYIFLVAAIVFHFAAQAQTVNVHFKNGQKIQFSSANVEYVDFSEKAPDPTVSAGAVVDLGLSVYWCSCNVGAEAPEEYGDYFAWGETKPKNEYTQNNYSYYNSNTATYTNIGDDISGTEYDAATMNLGSDWRMPTMDEFQELLDKCTWEWAQINGMNGYKVTAENGNSIFIPAAGSNNYSWTQNERTNYYTATRIGDTFDDVMYIWSSSTYKPRISNTLRYHGYPIRPVTTNPNAQGGPVDHSNDYLVTDKISAEFTGGTISSINGRIMSGSVLNVKFNNASSEPVTLIEMQLYDSGSSSKGNNILNEEVDVAGGNSQSYSLTLNTAMTTPVICFTYRYNKKKYTVEATYSSDF